MDHLLLFSLPAHTVPSFMFILNSVKKSKYLAQNILGKPIKKVI